MECPDRANRSRPRSRSRAVVVRVRRFGVRGAWRRARRVVGDLAEAFHLVVHRAELLVVRGEQELVDFDDLHLFIGLEDV